MLIDNTDKVPVSEALKLKKKMFWLELTDSNCHQCCKLRCVDLHGIQSLCARLHSLRLNNLR